LRPADKNLAAGTGKINLFGKRMCRSFQSHPFPFMTIIYMADKKLPTTATRRKPAFRPVAHAARRGRKKSKGRMMPAWMRATVAIGIIAAFSTGFYWLFIRPYAYRWKPCAGQKEYGVCMPCHYEVHGIDISHYQGNIDWERLASSKTSRFPVHFVFMKATEGADHADETFPFNFDQARRHGFIRGAYHFFSPRTDPVRQADFFIRNVRLAVGDLPPVLDVENVGKNTPGELKTAVKIWLDCIEAHYGVKPLLYTSYKFKNRYLNDSIFSAYPYWIAHYYVDSVKYEGPWHFWQHTDAGNVPGIKEEVDLDVFNGTLEQLRALTLRTP